jgi:hypothetical protein
MTEGKQRADWNHTAAVLAKLHNVNCAKKSDLKTPADFHPFEKAKERESKPVFVSKEKQRKILKRVFCGGTRD